MSLVLFHDCNSQMWAEFDISMIYCKNKVRIVLLKHFRYDKRSETTNQSKT